MCPSPAACRPLCSEPASCVGVLPTPWVPRAWSRPSHARQPPKPTSVNTAESAGRRNDLSPPHLRDRVTRMSCTLRLLLRWSCSHDARALAHASRATQSEAWARQETLRAHSRGCHSRLWARQSLTWPGFLQNHIKACLALATCRHPCWIVACGHPPSPTLATYSHLGFPRADLTARQS